MGATTVVHGVAGSWLTNVHVMLVGKDAARRYTWSGVEEKRKTLFYAHIFSYEIIFFFQQKRRWRRPQGGSLVARRGTSACCTLATQSEQRRAR